MKIYDLIIFKGTVVSEDKVDKYQITVSPFIKVLILPWPDSLRRRRVLKFWNCPTASRFSVSGCCLSDRSGRDFQKFKNFKNFSKNE